MVKDSIFAFLISSLQDLEVKNSTKSAANI